MKNKELVTMAAYEAPQVEVIEVEVEQGFAASTGSVDGTAKEEDMTGGGNIGVDW